MSERATNPLILPEVQSPESLDPLCNRLLKKLVRDAVRGFYIEYLMEGNNWFDRCIYFIAKSARNSFRAHMHFCHFFTLDPSSRIDCVHLRVSKRFDGPVGTIGLYHETGEWKLSGDEKIRPRLTELCEDYIRSGVDMNQTRKLFNEELKSAENGTESNTRYIEEELRQAELAGWKIPWPNYARMTRNLVWPERNISRRVEGLKLRGWEYPEDFHESSNVVEGECAAVALKPKLLGN